MRSGKASVRDPRNAVYLLGHLLLMVVGGLLALLPGSWTGPLGLSLMAAGIAGYVVFAYVLVSQEVSSQLEVLRRFGITSAFAARATKIQGEYEVRLARAHHHIDVVGFGLSALREDLGSSFAEWKTRAPVRVLLIDPEYPPDGWTLANQRDQEEARPAETIAGHVRAFVKETAPIMDERFQVRLYRCLPAVNIFRVDDEMLWGPYLIRIQGRNTPTFVARRGVVFDSLMDHFDHIWDSDALSRQPPVEWAHD